jgi:hypothetical protein
MNQITSSISARQAKKPAPNEDQQAAADMFFNFLFSNEKEMIMSGPGGVGKTFTMSLMIDDIMPRYQQTCQLMGMPPVYDEVHMTATTNKAAEVLAVATQRPSQTLASFLRLNVREDYNTGKSKLAKRKDFKVHENKILFVDECSMIDSGLYNMIHQGTLNCKIVYVGDHCQLAPVMERISPVFLGNKPFVELKQQMRNSNQTALMEVCNQLRETVETGIFKPIKIVPGVIDHCDDEDLQAVLDHNFSSPTRDHRILAYTNERVSLFNDYIRQIRNLPAELTTNEFLVNNNAVQLRNGLLSVEAGVKILSYDTGIKTAQLPDGVTLDYRLATIATASGGTHTNVPIAMDMDHLRACIQYFAKKQDWPTHFHLKQGYPDLRPLDAGTVYKAQGSTYETAVIDLGNISTCTNPNQAARMLYVAFSRARERVFLFGDLAPRFGGLIH